MPRGRPARATVYRSLETQLRQLAERFGGLPRADEAKFVWSDIWHLEVHHSTALEGNTLVLREVESLLKHDRAVGAKPLKDYLEVTGYGEAAHWVYQQARRPEMLNPDQLVTLQEVRHIHYVAMTPVWTVAPHPNAGSDESPGSFRKHGIHPFSAGMTPPSWPLVPAELDSCISLAQQTQLRVSGGEPLPEVLAQVHNQFEKVHPFLEGNSRVGRLMINLILVRLSYPPVIILKQKRTSYLKAMQAADSGGYGPFGEIMALGLLDNLNRFIIPSVAGPTRLVPLAALATKDISINALRAAASRGRLEAQQTSDGTWLSSPKAVSTYLNSRRSTK